LQREGAAACGLFPKQKSGLHRGLQFLSYLVWVGLRVFRSIGDEENRVTEKWYALKEELSAVPSSNDE
jgi:hypothetical protein